MRAEVDILVNFPIDTSPKKKTHSAMVTLVYYIPVCHEGHKGHKAMKVISLCLLGSLFFPTMPRRRRGRITTTSQATTRTVKAIMLIWAESLTLGNGCAGYKNKILKSIHTYYEVVN